MNKVMKNNEKNKLAFLASLRLNNQIRKILNKWMKALNSANCKEFFINRAKVDKNIR